MKTDSLFYRIFNTAPSLFFETIAQENRDGYEFQSVELKQTAFRIDGVFTPPASHPNQPTFFLEVQFQKDEFLYHRLFSELFLYLKQYPQTYDWQVVVIYPRRSKEQIDSHLFLPLLEIDRVQRIYLDEIGLFQNQQNQTAPPLGMGLIQLIVTPDEEAIDLAHQLLNRPFPDNTNLSKNIILDLVETILIYKLPTLTRKEIESMLGIVDSVKQTRVYQEAIAEGIELGREAGIEEGREAGIEEGREVGIEEGREVGIEEGVAIGYLRLILIQIQRRLGNLPPDIYQRLEQLSIDHLESLAEALFTFTTIADLEDWIKGKTLSSPVLEN